MDTESVLQRWQAEAAAIRARPHTAAAPLAREAVRGRAGLDVLRDMIEGRLPAAPIARTMDFMLIEVDVGRAVFQARPSAAYLNPMGTLHGGWYATLLDSCVGAAVHTTLAPHRAYTTLELKFNLVRAIGMDVPLVRAEGQVVHVGRQVATAEGRLIGPDGKLYAHATTTCLIFDIPA